MFDCSGTTGNYTFTDANSGKQTTVPWPPAGFQTSQTGQFTLGQFGGAPTYCSKNVVTITVTLKATWTHDAGQTDATDPAPPSVWLCESASSEWTQGTSGSASDGFGDAAVAHPDGSAGAISSTSPGFTLPPAHWKSYPVSGNTATLPQRTLTAEADNSAHTSPPFGGFCGAYIDNYTVTVHAQPYNFRSSGYTAADGSHASKAVQDNPNATLALSYVWDSTDGSHSHLGSCMIAENVTWDSNPAGVGSFGIDAASGKKVYAPPSPPAGTDSQGNSIGYLDPTTTMKPATDPGITDTFAPDQAYMPRYYNVSWWGDQTYVFSDTATGETATPLPGPAAGTFRITRAVALIPGTNNYGLTISTRGYPAGPMVLGHN